MTKPIVYNFPDDMGRIVRRIRQRPKVMWIRTQQGIVKAMNPRIHPFYPDKLWFDVQVEPRYCGTIRG